MGLNAQVYSYSRASGLFAGVALDGSAITIDHRSNELFYQRPGVLASEIIRSDAPAAPAPAQQLIAAIERSAHGTRTASTSETPAATGSTREGASETAPTQPGETGGVTTYPMEDQNPGEEPPP